MLRNAKHTRRRRTAISSPTFYCYKIANAQAAHQIIGVLRLREIIRKANDLAALRMTVVEERSGLDRVQSQINRPTCDHQDHGA
jgi:hypothetical protein